MTRPNPTAFLRAPALAPRIAPAAPAGRPALPTLAAFIPPPPPLATLTISPKGYMALHQSLRVALGLRDGQPINLLPPVYGSAYWHLDLRDTAPARIKWYADNRPRVEGIKLPPGLLTTTLTLHLLPGEPEYPHVHPMLPFHANAAQAPRP